MSEQDTPRDDEPQVSDDELESVSGGTGTVMTVIGPIVPILIPPTTYPTFPTEPIGDSTIM